MPKVIDVLAVPTMIQPATDLSDGDLAAMNDLVLRLRQAFGDALYRVTVFGSKARGDAHPDSDIDVLVVVRSRPESYRMLWNEVADTAWQVELAHGVVLSLVLKSDAEFDRMLRAGLLLATEIERDGVDLWMAQPSAATFASG